ncbi:hypothetical protein P3X46_030455 [Hevea brasiliensis]|uniref:BURP domain-containing protein n=1 Tax=Hevea brasiliensis TaxID=3981 RepID=A0ABQ9KHB4_HEVBR|nr:hypothetical protein P3X46_030455 [Hevea brasiliensis]
MTGTDASLPAEVHWNSVLSNTPLPKALQDLLHPVKFLPRKVADLIPFSSEKLAEIFTRFSVKADSVEAKTMKETIDECEATKIPGEDKYCATSLESLVDFSVAKLGKNVSVFTNEVEEESKEQEFTILCHKERYVYAVFYCHKINATKVYMVPLIGTDGSKAKALVICHMNTSAWSPQHPAFQLLKVKPGSPVCHFLNDDALVWVST